MAMTLVLCPLNGTKPTWANNTGGKGAPNYRCTKCGGLGHLKVNSK